MAGFYLIVIAVSLKNLYLKHNGDGGLGMKHGIYYLSQLMVNLMIIYVEHIHIHGIISNLISE